MIKKFFKAMLMGVRECEVIHYFATMITIFGWLPLLFVLVLTIFKINMNDEEVMAWVIAMMALGSMISFYIMHCIDAIRYQDENHCDFHTAWQATDTTPDDEF